MKIRSKIIIGMILMISIFTISCTSPSKVDETGNLKIEELNKKIADLNTTIEELNHHINSNQPQNLLAVASDTMELIKNKDMDGLSNYVHEEKRLRFTAYPYVDVEKDQMFSGQEVAELDQNTTVYYWGDYDGSGEPMELDFNEYYERFIYDHDFINPHMIGNNTKIGFSNTTNNVEDAYPNGEFLEFYFSGFEPEYAGIDWSSLTLVFEQEGSRWYLVGIIHGEWTI